MCCLNNFWYNRFNILNRNCGCGNFNNNCGNRCFNCVRGPVGPRGPKGEKGDKGDVGPATETIVIGHTFTSKPNVPAQVVDTTGGPVHRLDFYIPQGEPGKDGLTPTLTIGTVATDSVASASITGTPPNFVLNLVLPTEAKK